MIPLDPSDGQLPNCDPEAVRAAARTFGSAASRLRGESGSLTGTTGGVMAGHGKWLGQAGTAWQGQGNAAGSAIDKAAGAFERAASVLNRLAGQLEDAQTRSRHAAVTVNGIVNRQIAAAHSKVKSHEDFEGELSRASAAGSAAAQDALHAAAAAAGELHAIAGETPNVPPTPGVPPDPNHPGSEPPSFMTLLLGSVVGQNRLSGRAFQEEVMKQLGVKENFQRFDSETFAGKPVRVEPDSMQGKVWEMKGVGYQYSSSQIQGEMNLPQAEENGFGLVVRPDTRLSSNLVRDLNEQEGAGVYRYAGNGIFTRNVDPKEDNPELFRFNQKTGDFERVSTNVPETPQDEPPPPGGEGGAKGGGGAPAPEEPEEPVVPEEPEAPEMPEMPEMPEFPFLP